MINKLLYVFQFLKDILDNLFSNNLNEKKLLKKYLTGNIVYFDLGYNLGFETQKVISIFGKNLSVHAFDPNLINNFFSKNIKFNNYAVSKNEITQKFVKKKNFFIKWFKKICKNKYY